MDCRGDLTSIFSYRCILVSTNQPPYSFAIRDTRATPEESENLVAHKKPVLSDGESWTIQHCSLMCPDNSVPSGGDLWLVPEGEAVRWFICVVHMAHWRSDLHSAIGHLRVMSFWGMFVSETRKMPKKAIMNFMKLVIPLHIISWKKTPNDSVTPQRQSQFTPKMKANAVPRLLSSLVWIDQYN